MEVPIMTSPKSHQSPLNVQHVHLKRVKNERVSLMLSEWYEARKKRCGIRAKEINQIIKEIIMNDNLKLKSHCKSDGKSNNINTMPINNRILRFLQNTKQLSM